MKTKPRLKWQNGFVLTICLSILTLLSGTETIAQEQMPKDRHLLLSVFNSGTQLPGNFITLPIHPGVSAGIEFAHNRSTVNRWFQTAKLGMLYHQYSQTAVQLYSEGGYRRSVWRGLSAELRIGLGYLHSFTDVPIFKLNSEGTYRQVSKFGRPQFMAGGALGMGYTFRKAAHPWRIQLDYQFYVQTPFINEYVPLLPVNVLHVGGAVPLSVFKKHKRANN
ncbi:MAG TPA: hypothetical protein VK957_19410 [Lunatimonas sp.]|nr:hypothetical protein [Lunatimonas sp.]